MEVKKGALGLRVKLKLLMVRVEGDAVTVWVTHCKLMASGPTCAHVCCTCPDQTPLLWGRGGKGGGGVRKNAGAIHTQNWGTKKQAWATHN